MVLGTLFCCESKLSWGSDSICPVWVPSILQQKNFIWCLLSNIYINDLPNGFSLTQSLLFPNDTNIFCSHRTTGHLVSIANNELAKIVTWLKANKLSPNLTKTNLWFFIQGKRKLMLMYLLLWKILWTSKSWKLISAVIIDQHLSYNVMRVTKKQTNK